MFRLNTSPDEIESILENVPKTTVIAEFSGRDSVAAVMKSLEGYKMKNILPIASFAGTEYGDVEPLYENHKNLIKRIHIKHGHEKRVYPLIIHSSPDLWHAINGRFTAELIEKFGFYTPCIGCHAYFHLLRMPMAKKIGNCIISGEREGHQGRIKLNQLPECLDTYERILAHFDVDLLHPVRKIHKNEEIENLIGWDWDEGAQHPECVFSGNYRNLDGDVKYDPEQLSLYLETFLYPACIKLGELMLSENNPTKEQMVEVVKSCL